MYTQIEYWIKIEIKKLIIFSLLQYANVWYIKNVSYSDLFHILVRIVICCELCKKNSCWAELMTEICSALPAAKEK